MADHFSASYNPPFVALTPKVGDRVNVLHGYIDSNYYDLCCGDITVVEVKRNGTIVLANRMKFFSDGRGLARNNLCRIGPARFPHNDVTLTLQEREDAYVAYRATYGEPADSARALWRSDKTRNRRGF